MYTETDKRGLTTYITHIRAHRPFGYVKGGFRQRKRAHTYTNEFDQIVETTAFGKMTKK